jgi:ATP-dependent Lon protease
MKSPRSMPRTDKKKQPREKAPKRGGSNHHDDDDSDVDSHGNIRGLIAYSEEEESVLSTSSDEGFDPRARPRQRKAAKIAQLRIKKKFEREEKKKRKMRFGRKAPPTPSTEDSTYDEEDEEEDSRSEEEEEEDEETNESEEEGDDEDDEEEEEEDNAKPRIGLSFSFGGDDEDRMIPRRHNMKKESEDVKKFVKLISKPFEENTIDDQIDQFKSLTAEKQKALLVSLEKRDEYVKKEEPLMFRLLGMKLSPEMMATVMSRYNALQNMDPSSGEYYKLRSWMEKIVSLPLGIYKEMPAKLEDGSGPCSAFMERARICLEEAIYGQEEAKLQILQFIACKLTNPSASGLSLLLIGPPGIGKTSLIKNGIAKALEWPFQFISLGGDSDATSYTGHQFVYEGSHCGKIANSLASAKSMSCVLMFDELDKISTTAKGEEVQNLLVHLTDPVQNSLFEDKYLTGVPLDLSRVMFVFSGNDINKIDKILLDRMVVVHLKGYEQKEKIAIAEQFLVPGALREVNLLERVSMGREVLEYILKEHAGEEQGVRELKRCCEQIAQKINMLRIFNPKELPFHIPNFTLPFTVKKEHVDLFLKKKSAGMDVSVQRMYL